jgi:hypothetical protein
MFVVVRLREYGQRAGWSVQFFDLLEDEHAGLKRTARPRASALQGAAVYTARGLSARARRRVPARRRRVCSFAHSEEELRPVARAVFHMPAQWKCGGGSVTSAHVAALPPAMLIVGGKTAEKPEAKAARCGACART